MLIVISRLLKTTVIALLLINNPVLAGISVDSSRIIFQESDDQKGQSIGVTSSTQSTSPFLVKAQVLGDVKGTQAQTPFSVTPALFRLEPGTTNQLKILKTGNQLLPKNKESIFYLRVMALPAGKENDLNSRNEVGGAITVSVGSVVKLFYRPEGLSMTQQQAMASLRFSRQGNSLQVTNPSPYYITLASLSVNGKPVAISPGQQNTMIAPFATMTYSGVNAIGKVTWQAINDFGAKEAFDGTL